MCRTMPSISEVGLYLNGQGTLWVEDMALAAVGDDVAPSRSTRVEREVMIAESSEQGLSGRSHPWRQRSIMAPWMLGGDHSMDKSFASQTRDAR